MKRRGWSGLWLGTMRLVAVLPPLLVGCKAAVGGLWRGCCCGPAGLQMLRSSADLMFPAAIASLHAQRWGLQCGSQASP